MGRAEVLIVVVRSPTFRYSERVLDPLIIDNPADRH